MTQIQAGEGARFPHRRIPKGSLREGRSEGRATFAKKVRKLHRFFRCFSRDDMLL
jgi:hypothetical protein